MRNLLTPLVLAVLGSLGFTQESALDEYRKARALYSEGKFAENADAYEASIGAGAQSASTYYNAACSSALAGRIERSFRWLEEAIERGWRQVDHLKADSDLAALRSHERWPSVVEKCVAARDAFLKSLKHPDLYLELMEMKRIDQEFRTRAHAVAAAPGGHERQHEHDDESTDQQNHVHDPGHGHSHDGEARSAHGFDVDAKNTARMKEIVAEYGWPTASLVSDEGATAAWLLVQHADADPEFQRHCLELMKKVPEGEVSKVDLAYLTDRVLVNEGKKQLYGTQFWVQDGRRVPRPIEDEAGLEERRRKAGMQPFAEYARHMQGLHEH